MTTTSLDDLIHRTIVETEAAAARQQSGSADPTALGLTEPVVGHGDAWDDRIRVTLTDGRFTECDLPPQALRLGAEDLAEHVLTAANAAITDYQTQLMIALAEQQPDLSTLTGNLREIQADAVRAGSSYTDQMQDVLRAVRDR